MDNRTVLFYRDAVLAASETFILRQYENLTRYKAHFVGSRRVDDGLPVPSNDVTLVNPGGLVGLVREYLMKKAGVVPGGALREVWGAKPALIHAHFGPGGAVARYWARKLGISCMVTFYGVDATIADDEALTLMRRLYLRTRAAMAADVALVLAVSEHIKRRLTLNHGFPADKIEVWYQGIDSDAFTPAQPGSKSSKQILFVGRLVEKKGCTHLIDAFARVRATHPDARLTIAGDGPLRVVLKGQARSLRVPVEFAGFLSPDEVQRRMREATLVAVPSVTAASGDEEGLPNVVLEAQASGTPVVATDHSGIPEAVENEVTGLLVSQAALLSGNSKPLAHGINRLLSDPDLRRALSSRARANVENKFDMRITVAHLEALYDRVLGVDG